MQGWNRKIITTATVTNERVENTNIMLEDAGNCPTEF
jgi:hypothetical protein